MGKEDTSYNFIIELERWVDSLSIPNVTKYPFFYDDDLLINIS